MWNMLMSSLPNAPHSATHSGVHVGHSAPHRLTVQLIVGCMLGTVGVSVWWSEVWNFGTTPIPHFLLSCTSSSPPHWAHYKAVQTTGCNFQFRRLLPAAAVVLRSKTLWHQPSVPSVSQRQRGGQRQHARQGSHNSQFRSVRSVSFIDDHHEH